jgi:hypothetical protein
LNKKGDKEIDSKLNVFINMPYASYCRSFLVLVPEVLVLLLFAVINQFGINESLINNVFLVVLLVNSVLVPTVLIIYNYKICTKNKIHSFLVCFIFIAIALILSFVILYAVVFQLDRRVLLGYDRRQEVTGGMVMFGFFIASCLYILIGSVISQIILIFKKY